MGLPPKDAIAYFESKGYQITFNWRDVWQDSQAKAFTVSSVAKLDILEDIFYIFIILLAWICIIKAEITDSVVFIGNTKVHTDGLSMTYMKIAIWFRWETSLYASTIFTFL